MNLLKQSSKYNKYLDRINEYKLITDRNEAFSSIETRVENLHQDLKSNNNKTYYSRIHWGLLTVSLTLSVITLIQGFVVLGIVLIAAAVLSKYFYTQTLKSHIQNVDADQLKNQSSFDIQLKRKMEYIENGIDIKIARINIVRYSYMCGFALCMIAGLKLSHVPIEISFFVVSVMALMISSGFWFYFFKDDLDVLEFQALELEEYIQAFNAKYENNDNNPPLVKEKEEVEQKENIVKKQYFQDEQNSDDELTEVVPPMKRDKTPAEIYKQLSLDV